MVENITKPSELPKQYGFTLTKIGKFLKKYGKIPNVYNVEEYLFENYQKPLVNFTYMMIVKSGLIFLTLLFLLKHPQAPPSVVWSGFYIKAVGLSLLWYLLVGFWSDFKRGGVDGQE